MRNTLKNLCTKLSNVLNKVPGFGPSVQTITVKIEATPVVTKSVKQSFIKKAFRCPERLKIEAYVSATTQDEQDAIAVTFKD